MALTVTTRGDLWNLTPGTTFAVSPTSNLTAGALALLFISADNSASGGTLNNINSVSDSRGNVWKKVASSLCDPAAANAGVQGAIFATNQEVGRLLTSTTITITFGDSTSSKSWALNEVTAAAGSMAIPVSTGNGAEQTAATAPTVTTETIEVGEIVFGMTAIEGGGAALTADSDTTNGTWSAGQYNGNGTATGGTALGVQFKVQTTTASTQTYNPTLNVARDLICSWLRIREVTPKRLASVGVG